MAVILILLTFTLSITSLLLIFYAINYRKVNELSKKQRDDIIALRNQIYQLQMRLSYEVGDKAKRPKKTYKLNEILDEINEKGIDSLSKDKLNFLKKYNK